MAYIKKDGTRRAQKNATQREADRKEHEKLLKIIIPELRLGPLSNEALQAVTGCMDGRKLAAAIRRARLDGRITTVQVVNYNRRGAFSGTHTERYMVPGCEWTPNPFR